MFRGAASVMASKELLRDLGVSVGELKLRILRFHSLMKGVFERSQLEH